MAIIPIGKSNPLGVSWDLRDDGEFCKICEGPQIQVRYPASFGPYSGEQYDLLCIDCGTSVTEERGTKIGYDKRELLLGLMKIDFKKPGTTNYRYPSK